MVSKYSITQWFIILVYSVINLLAACTIALQGPFYPMVAEEKGVTPSQHGIVFGVFYLVYFILCPLTGILISRFGAVTISIAGLLIIGITNIMFGFVNHLYGVPSFLGTSVVIRILEGVGFSMTRSSAMAIVSCEFSEHVEMAFAFVQSSFQAGLLLGPVIGGALYEWGGFTVPFSVVGALLLCTAFILFFLPKNYPKKEAKSLMDIFKLLRLSPVIMGMFASLGSYVNCGFILSTLEPHLKKLSISPVGIGSLFLCNALSSMCSYFVWSKLCEKYDKSLLIGFISALAIVFGMALLGPAPYLFLDMSIYTSIFGLLINGIGMGGEQIAAFSLLNQGTRLANLPQNIQTHGMVSALYTCTIALGSFAGSLLGGYLFDTFQFVWASHFFMLYHLCLCIGICFYFCFWRESQGHEKMDNSIQLPYKGTTTYNSTE